METAPILDQLDLIQDHITELEAIKDAAKDFLNSINHSGIQITFQHHIGCLCGNCTDNNLIELNLTHLNHLVTGQ